MLRGLVAQYGTKKWAHLATIIKTKKSKQVIKQRIVCFWAGDHVAAHTTHPHTHSQYNSHVFTVPSEVEELPGCRAEEDWRLEPKGASLTFLVCQNIVCPCLT